MKVSSCVLVVGTLATLVHGAINSDEVTSLPGWEGKLPSKQYSGYLTVGQKHLHYWFVASEGDVGADPVTLWLNGGPGCSSLDGYLYEQGPFHANTSDPTQLEYNPWTWAKKSSLLYLEAPAGVGFSFSDDWRDYDTNDDITAETNRLALEQFFKGFPELKQNDFYITGESYAGVYVPTLAKSILEAKAAGTCDINLKGIAVGNGCTGRGVGVCGPESAEISVEYLHAHGLFSDATHALIGRECGSPVPPSGLSDKCEAALDEMAKEVGHVSIYDIYGQCTSSPQGAALRQHLRAPAGGNLLGRLGGPDACIDSSAGGAWINRDVARAALHLHMPPDPTGNWSTCGNNITYHSTEMNEPADVYPALVPHIRVLIYNGDADACVPYTDNEQWTTKFASDNNITVAKPWHAWNIGDDQVAGYATKYTMNDFTFVTVKKAGHMVPQIMPAQAFSMFEKFLSGNDF